MQNNVRCASPCDCKPPSRLTRVDLIDGGSSCSCRSERKRPLANHGHSGFGRLVRMSDGFHGGEDPERVDDPREISEDRQQDVDGDVLVALANTHPSNTREQREESACRRASLCSSPLRARRIPRACVSRTDDARSHDDAERRQEDREQQAEERVHSAGESHGDDERREEEGREKQTARPTKRRTRGKKSVRSTPHCHVLDTAHGRWATVSSWRMRSHSVPTRPRLVSNISRQTPPSPTPDPPAGLRQRHDDDPPEEPMRVDTLAGLAHAFVRSLSA